MTPKPASVVLNTAWCAASGFAIGYLVAMVLMILVFLVVLVGV